MSDAMISNALANAACTAYSKTRDDGGRLLHSQRYGIADAILATRELEVMRHGLREFAEQMALDRGGEATHWLTLMLDEDEHGRSAVAAVVRWVIRP